MRYYLVFLLLLLCILANSQTVATLGLSGNIAPIYATYPGTYVGTITAATTATHKMVTTNCVAIDTGKQYSDRIDNIYFVNDSIFATGVGFVALTDNNGANAHPLYGVLLPTTTWGTTTVPTPVYITMPNTGFQLSLGQILYACVSAIPASTGGAITVWATKGHY